MIYFVVFLIMRFMGKREIGKLSVFDFVISIMIAEMAVLVIEDMDRSFWEGVVPMAVLLVIQLITAFISLKSRNMRLLLDGKPSVIVANGKLNRDVMKKQRYNLDDLMLQLRENRVSRLADVEFAILETSGKLSVITKEDDLDSLESDEEGNTDKRKPIDIGGEAERVKPVVFQKEKSVIPPKYRFEILPIPLIMDGKVQDRNLEKLEKTRFWLKNVLQEQGVTDFKDVFLCTIDHKGKLFIDSDRKPRS
ncbi:YetF domain-containing protein [Paenibacillus sp. NPDC058071]|uniref:YetF domain-containing protein n=1 Tax=Paenibacillus sp. NPDC058071 TaxID=3346326 RepID=UPI0036DAD586